VSDVASLLLSAPESQLDAAMRPLIERWSKPPKAIEVLEVLDKCIHGSLASGFVVSTLQIIYDARLTEEKTSHDAVTRLATWRGDL
jgi:hypothetical protein